MRFKEFQQVALAKDIPEERLRRGDLATIVDIHPRNGGEIGYSIEVFNALGETIAVTTVPSRFLRSSPQTMFFTSDLSLDSRDLSGVARRGARTASILAENLGPSKNLHGENVDVRVAKDLRRRGIAVK